MDIRPMLRDDVNAAAEMILGHGWGVRREWLAFATANPRCSPLLATAGGEVVATAVGTANGPAGWIGTVFVAPSHRGRGLGRAITEAVIERLDAAGCGTLVLVATSEGRRLYERMGFEVAARYRILEAPGLPEPPSPDNARPEAPAVRAFDALDLPAMKELDRLGTGEDRGHALEALAAPGTARASVDPDGTLGGFVVRPPWGGGATVARTIEHAVAIVTARRRASGPDGRVRVGLVDVNHDGLERLTGDGFAEAWSAPRMVRGPDLEWHPEMIWGQFNHALG